MPSGQFLQLVFALMAGIASSVYTRTCIPSPQKRMKRPLSYNQNLRGHGTCTESGFQGLCFLAWQHDDDGEQNHAEGLFHLGELRDVKD